MQRIRLLCLLATLAAGCTESVESEHVLTSGVYANLSAAASCSGETELKATLRVGGPKSNTYLDLTGDDRLTARVGNATQGMHRHRVPLTEIIYYQANFSGVDDVTTDYQIIFERSLDGGAPNSHAEVNGVNLTIAPASSNFSRAQDSITLNWSPGAAAVSTTVTIDGACIEPISRSMDPDPGTLSLPAGTIQKKKTTWDGGVPDAGLVPDTCTVRVALNRTYQGSVDSNFGKGGTFPVNQACSTSFGSNP